MVGSGLIGFPRFLGWKKATRTTEAVLGSRSEGPPSDTRDMPKDIATQMAEAAWLSEDYRPSFGNR